MKTHKLKTLSVYFERIKSGEKTFEIRFNDRCFQKGDRVLLQEVDFSYKFTGESLLFEIGFVFGKGVDIGIDLDQYVVFSLLPCPIIPEGD